MSPRGPVLFRADAVGNLLRGLGPPRPAQPPRSPVKSMRATDGRSRQFRRDRSPNGVAWRFPDWTAVGFAFPSPFLGSDASHSPFAESHTSFDAHDARNDFWGHLGLDASPSRPTLSARRDASRVRRR